jgi:hypothetical protein
MKLLWSTARHRKHELVREIVDLSSCHSWSNSLDMRNKFDQGGVELHSVVPERALHGTT